MNRETFRIQPLMDVTRYVTYGARATKDTGIVTACKDAGCQAWTHGWETAVDESTDLGRGQARYIRTSSGRTFKEKKTADGMTVFVFEAHQRCFAEHRTKRDVFLRRDGDWRGNPTGNVFVHARPEDWVEDLMEHQDTLQKLIERG